MTKTTLIHLEFLRGAAALVVLASHTTAHIPFLSNSILRNTTNFGTEAVAVFFALSGFVMAHSQHNRPKTRSQFLRNRIIRIYPTYFTALALAYSVGAVTNNFPSHWMDIVFNLIFAGSIQHHFARLPATNLALWSLTFEMSFYALFSLCIVQKKVSIQRLITWSICSIAALLIYPYNVTQSGLDFFLSILAFSCSWLIGYFAYSINLSTFIPISLPLLAMIPAASRLPYDLIQSPLKFCVIALLTISYFKSAQHIRSSPKAIHGVTLLSLISLIAFFSKAQPKNIILYSLLPLVVFALCYSRNTGTLLQSPFIRTISLIIGRTSYSLYALHLPLIFLAAWLDSVIGYILLPPALALLVWAVEYRIQPLITMLTRR